MGRIQTNHPPPPSYHHPGLGEEGGCGRGTCKLQDGQLPLTGWWADLFLQPILSPQEPQAPVPLPRPLPLLFHRSLWPLPCCR